MADTPPPAMDFERLILALESKGENIGDLAVAMRESNEIGRRSGRRANLAVILIAVALTVGVANLFSRLSANRQHADDVKLIATIQHQNDSIQSQLRLAQSTSDAIAAATSGAAQARSAKTLADAIRQLEHCDRSYVDHDAKGVPLDPACPP